MKIAVFRGTRRILIDVSVELAVSIISFSVFTRVRGEISQSAAMFYSVAAVTVHNRDVSNEMFRSNLVPTWDLRFGEEGGSSELYKRSS